MWNRTPAEQVLFNHDLFSLIASRLTKAVDVGVFKSLSRHTQRCGKMFENQLMANPFSMLQFMMTMNKIQLGLFVRYLRRYAYPDCDRIFYHQARKDGSDFVATVFAALMMPRSNVIELLPGIEAAYACLVNVGFDPDAALMQSLVFQILYKKIGASSRLCNLLIML